MRSSPLRSCSNHGTRSRLSVSCRLCAASPRSLQAAVLPAAIQGIELSAPRPHLFSFRDWVVMCSLCTSVLWRTVLLALRGFLLQASISSLRVHVVGVEPVSSAQNRLSKPQVLFFPKLIHCCVPACSTISPRVLPLHSACSRRRIRDEIAGCSPPSSSTGLSHKGGMVETSLPCIVSPQVVLRAKAPRMHPAEARQRRGHRRSRSDPLSLQSSFCGAPLIQLAEVDEETSEVAAQTASEAAETSKKSATVEAVPLIHHQMMARGNIPHLKLMSAHSPRKTLMNSIRRGGGPEPPELRTPTSRRTFRHPSPLSRSTCNVGSSPVDKSSTVNAL
jgi:hypothetical protein